MYRQFRNREQMLNSGYELDDRDSTCRDCASPVTWGQTPNGERILLDGNNSARVHWDHCSKVQTAPPAAAPRTQPPASPPWTGTSPAQVSPAAQPPQTTPALVEVLRSHADAIRELSAAIREQTAALPSADFARPPVRAGGVR